MLRMAIIGLAAISMTTLVSGCNSTGNATLSAAVSTSTPQSTSSTSASPSSGGQVNITWTAATGNPEGYLLEQSTDGTNFSQVQAILGAASTSATVTHLTRGATYYFRMRTFNAAGESTYSGTYTAAIPAS